MWDVAARQKHKAKAYRRPLQVVSVRSVPSSKTFCLPPAPHPAFLRNATLSSFVERDSHRIVALLLTPRRTLLATCRLHAHANQMCESNSRAPGDHGFRLCASLLSRDDRDVPAAGHDALQLHSTPPKPAPWPSSPASFAAGSCGVPPTPGCAVRSQNREWVRSAKTVFHHPRRPCDRYRRFAAEGRSAGSPARHTHMPTPPRPSSRCREKPVYLGFSPTRSSSAFPSKIGLARRSQKRTRSLRT